MATETSKHRSLDMYIDINYTLIIYCNANLYEWMENMIGDSHLWTHGDLVTPHSATDLSQRWFR